jgi:polar amino acid transport system substrate-binding protein
MWSTKPLCNVFSAVESAGKKQHFSSKFGDGKRNIYNNFMGAIHVHPKKLTPLARCIMPALNRFRPTSFAWLFLSVLLSITATGVCAGTPEDVKSKGVLAAGVRTDLAPFGIIDQSGHTVGLDIAVAGEVAKRLGVKLELVPVTGAARIPMLQSGKIDVLLAGIGITAERARVVDFTMSYLLERDTLLLRRDSKISRVEDLAGKTVSASPGTTGEKKLREMVPDVKILNYQDLTQAYQAIKSGLAEAFVSGGLTLAKYAAAQPDEFRVADFSLQEYPIAMGVRKGDTEWLNRLNAILKQMDEDGTYAQIFNKWVGAESEYKLPVYKIKNVTLPQ